MYSRARAKGNYIQEQFRCKTTLNTQAIILCVSASLFTQVVNNRRLEGANDKLVYTHSEASWNAFEEAVRHGRPQDTEQQQ